MTATPETAEPSGHAQPLTTIRLDDARAWIRHHGFDPDDVFKLTIRFDHHVRADVGVWLDVDWYLRNAQGNLYTTDHEQTAAGHSTIPMQSWPTLVDVEPQADQQ